VKIRLLIVMLGMLMANDVCQAKHVLIIVGPDGHGPGSHEPIAGARLLKHCVETLDNANGHTAEVVAKWPAKEQQQRADTVVFLGDTFPANRFDDAARNLADLHQMMKRGCGIVCIHYATGLKKEDVSATGEHPLLGWMGGYFANPGSVHHVSYARIFEKARITPTASKHPILRGWSEFVVKDEPYGNNYFGPDDNKPAPNVTILATDEVAGLEVLNRQGEWIQAPHVPGAFVCNIGDCLMRWSNDTYVSTPHRVRPPARERFSIAFFLEVNPDSVVDPRDIVPDQTPKYEPVTCADYLASRLNATYDHREPS